MYRDNTIPVYYNRCDLSEGLSSEDPCRFATEARERSPCYRASFDEDVLVPSYGTISEKFMINVISIP